MVVTLQCPRLSCRAILRVPDTTRGHRVRCSECGMMLVVPAGGKPRPAPQRPAAEKSEKAKK